MIVKIKKNKKLCMETVHSGNGAKRRYRFSLPSVRGGGGGGDGGGCLLYTSPSPRDGLLSRMPSSA